eukprot:5230928-Amphidinium_carterae.1
MPSFLAKAMTTDFITVGFPEVERRVAAWPGQRSCNKFFASFTPAAVALEANLALSVESLTPPLRQPSKCFSVEWMLEEL